MKIIQTVHRETPFKQLSEIPEHVGELKSYSGESARDIPIRVIEIDNLKLYKKFLHDFTEFEDKGGPNSSMRKEHGGFTGTKTWDDYVKQIDNGDAEMIKNIKLQSNIEVKNVEHEYHEVLTRYRFDVTGEFFDIGLVLSGVPESWGTPEYDHVDKPKLDILINAAYNCEVSKDTVIKNGARLIAICRVLEDHGVQVSIRSAGFTQDYARGKERESILFLTNIKGYNEPVNYEKVSSMLSPGYFRRGIFKLMEVVSVGGVVGGYGSSGKVSNAIDISDDESVEKFEKEVFNVKASN